MNRFIAVNPSRCTGCQDCLDACSDGHRAMGEQTAPRLALVEGTVTAALSCHHCEGAPCLAVCPVDAIQRDDRGAVWVDEHRCVGCKLCAVSCPFGAIRMGGTGIAGVAGICYDTFVRPAGTSPLLDYQIGVQPVSVKCDLCAYDDHPHCVEACQTNALRLVESDDPNGDGHYKRVRAGRDTLADFVAGANDGKGEERK